MVATCQLIVVGKFLAVVPVFSVYRKNPAEKTAGYCDLPFDSYLSWGWSGYNCSFCEYDSHIRYPITSFAKGALHWQHI